MQTAYNAEYLIYETEGDCDPIEINVEGYADIETLKSESLQIIRNACKSYKVAGNEVRVTFIITNSSGEYIDHDEITLSILENNEENRMNISTLIDVCFWGVDDGLILAEQERDSEEFADAALCYKYAQKMGVPSAIAERRHPHSEAWRQAKQESIAKFVNLCAKGEIKNV
jgi:hypothetical protein